MKNEHLHLLIDEEIYLVDSEKSKVESKSIVDSRQSASDSEIQKSPIEAIEKDPAIESIPNSATEEIKTVKFVFIHNSDNQEELELLNNIVSACKLETTDFKIIKEDEEVNYANAVIFTNEVDQVYSPIKQDQRQFLYSKPLVTLLNSKEEKGRLWSALQEFVNP